MLSPPAKSLRAAHSNTLWVHPGYTPYYWVLHGQCRTSANHLNQLVLLNVNAAFFSKQKIDLLSCCSCRSEQFAIGSANEPSARTGLEQRESCSMRIRTLAIFLRRFKTKSISCFLLFTLMNSGVLLGIPFARSAIVLNQKRLDLAGNHNGKQWKAMESIANEKSPKKIPKNGRVTVHRPNPTERTNL